MSRIILASDINFYVNASGSDSNNGLTPSTPKATLQAAYNLVRSKYDLAGCTATINCAKGLYQEALIMTGPLVGQAGPSGLWIAGTGTGNNLEDCHILPPAGYNCISAAFGASAQISGFLLNGSYSNQDLLAVGQQSTIIIGNNTPNTASSPPCICFGPAQNPANHITIAFGRAGIQVQNNYSIWCAGHVPQCHIDADDAWMYYNTNGTPGLMSVTVLDNTAFSDSFVHCSNSNMNMQAIGWNMSGGAPSNTVGCIVEKAGVVDTGTSLDFAQSPNLNYFPGTKPAIIRGGGVYC